MALAGALATGASHDIDAIAGFLAGRDDDFDDDGRVDLRYRGGEARIVWQLKTGEGYGIGTVSRGRYFHFDRVDDRAQLLCLNAKTGEQIWRFAYRTDYADLYDYSGGPRCSPVIDGDRVYVEFDVVVFDEAHSLEDIAADYLGISVSANETDGNRRAPSTVRGSAVMRPSTSVQIWISSTSSAAPR